MDRRALPRVAQVPLPQARTARPSTVCWRRKPSPRWPRSAAAITSAKSSNTWKTLLLNQFHDILPGTSIGEVYEETTGARGRRQDSAKAARQSPEPPPEAKPALLVANVSLNPRPLSVLLDPEYARGRRGPRRRGWQTAACPGDRERRAARTCPRSQRARTRLEYANASKSAPVQDVSAEVAGGRAVLHNGLLRVEIGEDGTLHGVYDREASREVLDGRANQLWAYTDKPRNWEAWDVDEGYEQEEEISGVESVEVVENGPLRASVRVVRRWRGSIIAQTYRLLSGSRRLDIESYVDWHERRVLLRVLFPLAVRSHETTCETMFGAVRRPTHHNTTWDATRFESRPTASVTSPSQATASRSSTTASTATAPRGT